MPDIIIQIKNLKKSYGNITPIKNITVDINKGDVISIIGPSGCGKSTLLRMINGLEEVTEGNILINGEDICSPKVKKEKIREKLGMIFQSFNLFLNMTVIENVMYGLIYKKHKSKQEAYDIAIKHLKSVEMDKKIFSYPEDLSGGQKQRVAIARALAMEPEIILFDEPTSALDPIMVKEVQNVIKGLAEKKYTMMIVTHEMRFAKEVANRVFYLDEGTIYEEGTPKDVFENPKREKTKIFINKLKAITDKLNKSNFNLYELLSKIELFCRKNFIDTSYFRRINVVIEELICENIIPYLNNNIDFLLSITYNDNNKNDPKITIEISFSDKIENPLNRMDDISRKLLFAVLNNENGIKFDENVNRISIVL